jgi:hypothetical protein
MSRAEADRRLVCEYCGEWITEPHLSVLTEAEQQVYEDVGMGQ